MNWQKPKVIVFDIGGVLLNWRVDLVTIANILKITPEEIHNTLKIYLKDLELGKLSAEDFWKHVANKYNYTGNPYDLKKSWVEGQLPIESG